MFRWVWRFVLIVIAIRESYRMPTSTLSVPTQLLTILYPKNIVQNETADTGNLEYSSETCNRGEISCATCCFILPVHGDLPLHNAAASRLSSSSYFSYADSS
ncbi:hypothetical protein OUZ56_015948 [Daphnia magna]|uniref:Secreted protein n=1 Tax=Daphnia magna TaxID=35525 RepID=A0ABR0AP80_9CRUS|nr:hypothetical protein OUZ56_015948 [Daphnia magna]